MTEAFCTAPEGSEAKGYISQEPAHHWPTKLPSNPVRCSLLSPWRRLWRHYSSGGQKHLHVALALQKGTRQRTALRCVSQSSLSLHTAAVPIRLLLPCPLYSCEIGSWCGGTVETEMLITPKRITGAVNEKWHPEGGATDVTQEVQCWKGKSKKSYLDSMWNFAWQGHASSFLPSQLIWGVGTCQVA